MNNDHNNPQPGPMAFTGITTKAGAKRLIDILTSMGYHWRGDAPTEESDYGGVANRKYLYIKRRPHDSDLAMRYGNDPRDGPVYDVSWLDNEPRATMPDGRQYTASELREALRQVEG